MRIHNPWVRFVVIVCLVGYVRFVPVYLSAVILRRCGDIESRRGLTNTSALFPHSPPYFCNPIQPPTLANPQPSTDDRSPANSQKLATPLPQPCRVRGSTGNLAPAQCPFCPLCPAEGYLIKLGALPGQDQFQRAGLSSRPTS